MKRSLTLVLVLIMMFTLTTGCQKSMPSNVGDPESTVETLTVATTADIFSMDPQLKKDVPSGRIKVLVFETLVRTDEFGNIVPAIAKKWEFVDDTTIHFTINEGIKFHNGESLTMEDILFSFQRGENAPQTGITMQAIDIPNCKAISDNVFEMNLKYPSGAIMVNLADSSCSIVPKAYIESVGEQKFAQEPIGTGPYTFDNWVSGDRIELSKFKDYWGDDPYFGEIVFRVIVESANRAIELETGGVDMAIDVLPADINRITENPELTLYRAPNYSVTYMAMNQQKEELSNVKVRKAISLALDLESIVDAVYGGTGSPGRGPMSSSVWGFNKDMQTVKQDKEKAKQLLTEAGYENGIEIQILTSDHQQRIDFCEIAQNQLAQVGIKCEVKIMEWGAYLDAIFLGEFDMTVLGFSYGADPVTGLTSVFHSEMFGANGNISWYRNEEVDRLLDAAKSEMDTEKRREMVEKVQKHISDDAVWVFIWQGENLTGTINGLEGFVLRPDSMNRLQDIYKE